MPGQYLAGKAPNQVQPGIRKLEGVYVDDLGRSQPWTAHYDEYGRQVARTDYNAGNRTQGIPDIHYHLTTYDDQFPDGCRLKEHFLGEYGNELP